MTYNEASFGRSVIMGHRAVSLHDRYDLGQGTVLLNGTQALVRLMLMQKARDRAAGLNTAGYVTGYRGSPLGAVDQQMQKAQKDLQAADVRFEAGLNEDLAATALWGTQQAELRGEGKFDGVFGLWYGKGPGVDRSGDVMRHANMAGSSAKGGVLMAMGDDHTGESSTVCHQSDWAMVDAYMPVLSPAGVQEILDYGLYGFALSRFSGLWVGLKTMKDTVEVTSVVDGSLDRMTFVTPDFPMPEGGLNIRLNDHWITQEARMIDQKRFAAEAFSRANRIDKRIWGKPGARIGFVAAGKNWLDLSHALALLGIDEARAEALGITTYKIGQTFPLDMTSFHDWAEGLDLIVCIEEKRKLIEVQIKEAIFDDRQGRRVYGWYKGGAGGMHEEELFPTRMAIDPMLVAEKLGDILIEEGCGSEALEGYLNKVREARRAENAPDIAARTPYFCSGCPHNTSTKVPEGSRAYAGIGCHIMALWMDRDTSGYTHMGGEGANWIGEAKFSKREHVFQNLGDGTYNHSGIQAIRAALASDVNITYKILFNDAVTMTGGQRNEGGLSADHICRELQAMGVEKIALVYDEKEEIDFSRFPSGLMKYERAQLPRVQEEFSKIKGVSVIVYVQTCAAEKRRRRKKGEFPDPDKRVFINTDVCEGCGDCGVQSNCVSIVPVETELGTKRAIDQSSCNKDFSCLNGFCPSFVTIEGAKLRKNATETIDIPDLPDPTLPEINGTHNIVVAGVGGTGVVTIGAILAMAAHIDGKGAGMMEMAGLAQKGGAVQVHCRIGESPAHINAIRVAMGECDALIGGDLVVSAVSKTLELTTTGRTKAAVNGHEIITGDFTRKPDFRLPIDRLRLTLEARFREGLAVFDASELARKLLGDSVYSNMVTFGASWQQGAIPLSHASIMEAITLNGASVECNKRAFEIGRWAIMHPTEAAAITTGRGADKPLSLQEKIDFRAQRLVEYQGPTLAEKYRRMVERFEDTGLKNAVADGYYKVLAYKDEYEVARLHLETLKKAEAEFEGDLKMSWHMAPSLISPMGVNGRPKKRRLGPAFARLWPVLAWLKALRGTPLDLFGYTAERRMERALIAEYEHDMEMLLGQEHPVDPDAAIALALLPLQVRGFGPVKMKNREAAAKRRAEILDTLAQPSLKATAE